MTILSIFYDLFQPRNNIIFSLEHIIHTSTMHGVFESQESSFIIKICDNNLILTFRLFERNFLQNELELFLILIKNKQSCQFHQYDTAGLSTTSIILYDCKTNKIEIKDDSFYFCFDWNEYFITILEKVYVCVSNGISRYHLK